MSWSREPASFALVGFPDPPLPEDLALLEAPPAQCVRDADGTTLLVPERCAGELVARHPSAAVEAPLDWYRFEQAMSWEVVGFLARVSGALARAGVPLGAVCGFRRDHLFVARVWRARTEAVLAELFPARR